MKQDISCRSIGKKANAVAILVALVAVGDGWGLGGAPFAGEKQAASSSESAGYGLVDAEDPLAERARHVFERVPATADKRIQKAPQLVIVGGKAGPAGGNPGPLAVCLPKGSIVISKESIDICYQGVREDVGDARFAFVLGHELGHLADDDFWHLAAYWALGGEPACRELRKIVEDSGAVTAVAGDQRWDRFLTVVRSREMRADDQGFLYAVVVGYPVDVLLGDNKETQYFFHFRVQQAGHSRIDPEHPTPEQRVGLLRARLKEMLYDVDPFMFGVRLAHFERNGDAVYFLEKYQKVFPSCKVFSNLGYCPLRMAIRDMGPSQAYRYWLPSILDVQTQAESLHLMGPGDGLEASPRSAVKEQLKKAVTYLTQACEMDETYLPDRINLAAAYLYLGDNAVFKARTTVEEAVTLHPDDPEVKMLRALIVLREGQGVDMWPETVKVLEEIAARPDAHPWVRYNLAVIYKERGREGVLPGSGKLWPGALPPCLRH